MEYGGYTMTYPLSPLNTPRKNHLCKIAYHAPNALSTLVHACQKQLKLCDPHQTIIVVCIGTDRSTGDCLGPLVGTQLSKRCPPSLQLFGTLQKPVHAINLQETMKMIHTYHQPTFVIAIDACLGQSNNVGVIQIGTGPICPGSGVNKQLPPIGDMHITGVVNVKGFMEHFVLQNTRLYLVMEMSEMIATAMEQTLYAAYL